MEEADLREAAQISSGFCDAEKGVGEGHGLLLALLAEGGRSGGDPHMPSSWQAKENARSAAKWMEGSELLETGFPSRQISHRQRDYLISKLQNPAIHGIYPAIYSILLQQKNDGNYT